MYLFFGLLLVVSWVGLGVGVGVGVGVDVGVVDVDVVAGGRADALACSGVGEVEESFLTENSVS